MIRAANINETEIPKVEPQALNDHVLYSHWENIIEHASKNKLRVSKAWKEYRGFLSFAVIHWEIGKILMLKDDKEGYFPNNVNWVNPIEHFTIIVSADDTKRTLTEQLDRYFIPHEVLTNRLHNGWIFEKALTTPAQDFELITATWFIYKYDDVNRELRLETACNNATGYLKQNTDYSISEIQNMLNTSYENTGSKIRNNYCIRHVNRWFKLPLAPQTSSVFKLTVEFDDGYIEQVNIVNISYYSRHHNYNKHLLRNASNKPYRPVDCDFQITACTRLHLL